jgi:hypothetical protein
LKWGFFRDKAQQQLEKVEGNNTLALGHAPPKKNDSVIFSGTVTPVPHTVTRAVVTFHSPPPPETNK